MCRSNLRLLFSPFLPRSLSLECKVVSGCGGTTYLVGECAFVLWCCQHYRSIGLNLITLEVLSHDVETSRGVKLTVKGICQVKVKTTKVNSDGTVSPDISNIRLAAQHFLGQPEGEVRNKERNLT